MAKGMAGVNKGYEPAAKGSVTASDGPTGPAGQKAAKGSMGAKETGGKARMSQGGDAGGFAAGRARTNKGRNKT